MLVVGEKEMNEKVLSVRRQGVGDLAEAITIEKFVENILREIKDRKDATDFVIKQPIKQ
jgi:threonyl-tRNA synthetase